MRPRSSARRLAVLGALLSACSGGDPVDASTDRAAARSTATSQIDAGPDGALDASASPTPDDLADVEFFEGAPWADVPGLSNGGASSTDDWPAILERGSLRVLVSYSRTDFFLAEGRLRGFEYELFHQLESALSKDRGPDRPPLVVEFLPVAFDDLLPALIEGRGDVAAAGLSVTPEREEFVAFTDPYLTGVDAVLVSHVDAEPVADVRGLAGRDVHVVGSTSHVDRIEEWNDELIAAGLAPVNIVPAARGLSPEDLLELVHSGAFQHTVADRYVAELWAQALDGVRVEQGFTIGAGDSIAWAVRRENPLLRDRLSREVPALREGSATGNILFRRYFEGTKWIERPPLDLGASAIAPFLADLRRHAADFGFDWRLLAAQAYQESRLDPDAVSRSGAVGLMQLLPATAKDMGVTDLRDPERNLYAGAKYMAWLREHFFGDLHADEAAQHDFCLAAYNAGPGRVRRWRRAAPARGLDPDVWFGNVELLALEDVGLEPVRYVGNINKYYVLFRLSLEELELREDARARVESGAVEGAPRGAR